MCAIASCVQVHRAEYFRVKLKVFLNRKNNLIKNVSQKIISQLDEINNIKRTDIPISELTVALQCGGSDSYSGITANPALGFASDKLVDYGGSSILSETSEIYGAEHLLFERSINKSNT